MVLLRPDPPTSADSHFQMGLRAAVPAAEVQNLEQLFDRHFAQHGYSTDQLKRFTIDGLREKLSWHAQEQISHVLAERDAAVARLLPEQLPHAYCIYNGYAIVLHRSRFYAVPRSLRDFSIRNGVVVRVSRRLQLPDTLQHR